MLHIPDEKARKKAAKRKARLGKSVRPPKASEMEFRRLMSELWTRVLQPAADKIMAMTKEGRPILEIAGVIEEALRIAETEYARVSANIAGKWKAGVARETRQRLESGMRAALGIDMGFVLDGEPVRTALELKGIEAANLIVTIPGEYLGRVAQVVADNFAGRKLAHGNLTNELLHLGAKSKRRAELIARDQTSKLTGTLNKVRQEAIGITEYIWRTSKDSRVSGDPSGKYPDADKNSTFHGDHYARDGKRFKWSEPPPDGHPGEPGFCRCHAQPVIDPAAIVAHSEGRILKV